MLPHSRVHYTAIGQWWLIEVPHVELNDTTNQTRSNGEVTVAGARLADEDPHSGDIGVQGLAQPQVVGLGLRPVWLQSFYSTLSHSQLKDSKQTVGEHKLKGEFWIEVPPSTWKQNHPLALIRLLMSTVEHSDGLGHGFIHMTETVERAVCYVS